MLIVGKDVQLITNNLIWQDLHTKSHFSSGFNLDLKFRNTYLNTNNIWVLSLERKSKLDNYY